MTRPLDELLAAADALKVAPLPEADVWRFWHDGWAYEESPNAERIDELALLSGEPLWLVEKFAHRDMIACELADAVRELQLETKVLLCSANAMRDEWMRVSGERDELRAKLKMKTEEHDCAAEDVIELRKKLAEVERDAARYRWLREQHWSNSQMCVVTAPKQSVILGSS